jgi:hypothetical protein
MMNYLKGNNMKRLMIITPLMLLSTQGGAATLNLTGSIADSCVLNSVVSNGNTLNIASGGTITVAQTSVSCNHKLGYKLRASSANNGVLINGSSPANNTAYSLKVFGTGTLNSVNLTTSPADVVNTGPLVSPEVSDLRQVDVTVTPVAVPWSGTYTDTVTITLTPL